MLILNVCSRQQVGMHSVSNNELVAIKLMVNPHHTKKKVSSLKFRLLGSRRNVNNPKNENT
jgi:hypothetical protein